VVSKSCPDAAESVGGVERAFLSKGEHRGTENITSVRGSGQLAPCEVTTANHVS
jgi:hypothetical protein